jgi:hypothetical protein
MRLVVVAFVAVRLVKKLDIAVSACAKRLVEVAFVAFTQVTQADERIWGQKNNCQS